MIVFCTLIAALGVVGFSLAVFNLVLHYLGTEDNQPECLDEEKRHKVQELADALGVEIEFL